MRLYYTVLEGIFADITILNLNKLALLWDEAQLCLPYVCN